MSSDRLPMRSEAAGDVAPLQETVGALLGIIGRAGAMLLHDQIGVAVVPEVSETKREQNSGFPRIFRCTSGILCRFANALDGPRINAR